MVEAAKLHLLYLSPSPGIVENHYAELFAKISELVQQYNRYSFLSPLPPPPPLVITSISLTFSAAKIGKQAVM